MHFLSTLISLASFPSYPFPTLPTPQASVVRATAAHARSLFSLDDTEFEGIARGSLKVDRTAILTSPKATRDNNSSLPLLIDALAMVPQASPPT